MSQRMLRKSFACMMLSLAAHGGEPAPPSVVEGNTAFAIDFYKGLKDQPGNLFFSPHSISTALAMTYAGAKGETEAQMAKTLCFDLSQDDLHPAFARLQKDLTDLKGSELTVANRLWGQMGCSFLDSFLKTARVQYGAGLEPLDFQADAEGARKTINAWVGTQTRDRIKDLLKPGVLDSDTRLVLTNAICFKGIWKSRFKTDSTWRMRFHVTRSQKVDSPMMAQTGSFGYAESKDLQILELPYQGETLSMVIFLPKERDGLADLEGSLNADALKGWLAGLRPTEVEANLPTFRMTSDFSLRDTLSALGMPSAFEPGKADFSGIADAKQGLFISAVVHKAFVEVNEEGTEAAAATAASHSCGAPPRHTVFLADQPFLFLIRDRKSGAILFMGRVVDPSV